MIIMLRLFFPPEFLLVESCFKGHYLLTTLFQTCIHDFICSVEDILKNAGNLSVGEKYYGSQYLPSTSLVINFLQNIFCVQQKK